MMNILRGQRHTQSSFIYRTIGSVLGAVCLLVAVLVLVGCPQASNLNSQPDIHPGDQGDQINNAADTDTDNDGVADIDDVDDDNDGVADIDDVDDDDDGLIEIHSLEDLDYVRYNLAGTSYKTSATDTGLSMGCPDTGCNGYELARSLDFDSAASYAGGAVNTEWSSGANGWMPLAHDTVDGNSNGFTPIFDGTRFTAIFDGNGNTISNLLITRASDYIGLFGSIGTAGRVRNLGVDRAQVTYTGSSNNANYVGILSGRSEGTIVAVSTGGTATGGDENFDDVGGIVGHNRGTITASYATGDADGGDGRDNRVGGLVGRNRGTITASYATGDADGGDGSLDSVGGLVGWNDRGTIRASYATGAADGGNEISDSVGGLVGYNQGGTIAASYATGRVDGEFVGGLVGENSFGGTITASYGFGTATGETAGVDRTDDASGGTVVPDAGRITAANSSTTAAHRWSTQVWDFGTNRQLPALRWVTDSSFGCDVTLLPAGQSCSGIIPGQSRTISSAQDVDDDDDGLIEIHSLEDLDYIRYNLAGTSYKTSATDAGSNLGCPDTGCNGYELARSLDFDSADSYAGGAVNAEWSSGTNGWMPIGDDSTDTNATRFTAIFEGNDNTISNLLIARTTDYIGLFGSIGTDGRVRNLGVDGAQVTYTGSSNNANYVGILAGQSGGAIVSVHTDGTADGGGRGGDRVGGLVGLNNGAITASYATGNADGDAGDRDIVGGLVGLNGSAGTITVSYATGDADGGDGNSDDVGGFVGQNQGPITASYATGRADGGTGRVDFVGGLVGRNNRGTITASYATGRADGGDGNSDFVGGLVGYNQGGTIVASYATGDADGGDGNSDRVGGLVGRNIGPNMASYGFGTVTGETAGMDRADDASDSTVVPDAGRITVANSSTIVANRWSIQVWDFGTNMQFPALLWVTDSSFGCDATLLPAGQSCGDIIPGQSRTVPGTLDVDVDDDGLIEINTLEDLDYIRYNLAGTSYKTSAIDAGSSVGCPDTGCNGYELARSLDFDSGASYAGGINSEWSSGTNGWTPIGDNSTDTDATRFTAVFEGNGNTISNLLIARASDYIGLFGYIGTAGRVRNLGLPTARVAYTGSSNAFNYVGILAGWSDGTIVTVSTGGSANGGDGNRDQVGGLVGRNGGGTITASYATGSVDGGDGNEDEVGGLVGYNDRDSMITASYATGDVDGGDGNGDNVGGLVGDNFRSTITGSYATGSVNDGDGNGDPIGGLVGSNGGAITASYATGAADGGDGEDFVGGLAGVNGNGTITASYATGSVDGGDGADRVGGLVGSNGGTVTASYATGAADGGDGDGDNVGGLVGFNGGTITASYGFGTIERAGVNRADDASDGTAVPDAARITAANSSTTSANGWSAQVWNFGTNMQTPALKWVIDSSFACDANLLPAGQNCGGIIPGQVRTIPAAQDVDVDNDGLIEINTLEDLDRVRLDLNGDGVHNDGINGIGHIGAVGAPISEPSACDDGNAATTRLLCGYELARSLDFDSGASYAGGINTEWSSGTDGWLPLAHDTVDGNGFTPIFDGTRFTAIFDGNGNTISNLLIARTSDYIGLFGSIGTGGRVRNLGVEGAQVTYTGSSDNSNVVGILAGQSEGTIVAVNADGSAAGGDGNFDEIGGLVGENRGTITTSYATGDADGGDGSIDSVGGLVGNNNIGTITASYATGSVDGGDGDDDNVGGLVGYDNSGIIVASYATGDADGGDGDRDSVGGLVGLQRDLGFIPEIMASYATGRVDGEVVGGLVGTNDGIITTSYWDTTTSGWFRGVGGVPNSGATGLSMAQMQSTRYSFPDFSAFYGTGTNPFTLVNNCYPRLKTWTGAGADGTVGTADDTYSATLLPGQTGFCVVPSDPTGTWVAANSGTGNSLRDVAFASGRWVAVGKGGTIRTATNPAGTWTGVTGSGTTEWFQGVGHANRRWVAVGNHGVIRTATDPTGTWTAATNSNTDRNFLGVAFGDGRWVAVGAVGTIRTATDPTGTWTASNSGTTEHLLGVAFANGRWVAVGANGTIRTTTNPTGTWTASSSGITTDISSVAFDMDKWVAVSTGGVVRIAANATDMWTTAYSVIPRDFSDVAFANRRWVVVGSNGAIYSTTHPHSQFNFWRLGTSGTTSPLSGVAFANGRWVAVGQNGTIRVAPLAP